jgi:hypothetical protein
MSVHSNDGQLSTSCTSDTFHPGRRNAWGVF